MALSGGESGPATRRALLVGVQRGLDVRLGERPGTCAAVRRIGGRLSAGGWQVALLLDDEPADHNRPWRANLLERLGWLAEAGEALILLSGPVRQGFFCCRDSRLDRLESTAVPLADIAAELPPQAGVILDAPADREVFERVAWALGAGPADSPEALRGVRGPTPFLDAVLRATSGEDRDELTVESLAGFVERAAEGPWRLGASTSGALLTDLEQRRRTCRACDAPVSDSVATFCPGCGAPLEVEELLDGGRYRLVRRLGAGGMGQVYLAEDTRLKVRRALKLLALPPGLKAAEREKLRLRMVQEARAAQALCAETHHVVQVYDVGFSPERGEPFLVMELLEGRTLTERLAEGPLSDGEALAIGRQIAATLAVAHGRGFVHRDLKPDNIMLVERGGRSDFVKLLDFGLVKAEQAEVSTETGRMMGTLQYMPPEQLRGLKVDARADVFSLGAVLYECFSGQRANPGTTQQEIFAVLLDRGVRSLVEVAPLLPAPLVTLVDRCLELIPDKRPPDARAVSAALEVIDPRPLHDDAPVAGSGAAPPAGTLLPGRGPGTALPRAPAASAASALGTADTGAPVSGPIVAAPTPTALGGEESRLPAGPVRAPVSSVPPVSAPDRGPRRWLLILPLLAVAGGIAVWRDAPPPPPPVVDAALDAAPDMAPDAAPDVTVDAGPQPFERPAHPLPARPAASRAREGEWLIYRADTPADAFAALALDMTLAAAPPPEPDVKAGERWQAAPDDLRRWLADGVPTDGLTALGGELRVPLDRLERLRATRPEATPIRGLGVLLTRGDDPPAFETVNCSRGRAGDRVLTAQWKMRGYGTGACEAGGCGPALARAVQQARQAGERLRVSLTLVRRTEDGDDPAHRVSARCYIRP